MHEDNCIQVGPEWYPSCTNMRLLKGGKPELVASREKIGLAESETACDVEFGPQVPPGL